MRILIAKTISLFAQILIWALVISAVLSWIPARPDSVIYKIRYWLDWFTEPIVGPCRKALYKLGLMRGGIDFSPIIAFLIIGAARNVLIRLIFMI